MKWYIDSDPFLDWRPFPKQTDNALVEHWHEILFFTLFFHLIKEIAPLINTKVFGQFYVDLAKNKPKTKLDYDIRVVGIFQAIMSVFICIPMFMHPLFTQDPIKGSYPFASLVTSFCVGYFLWDLIYCCIFHFDLYGTEFLFHAFGALIVFASTYYPFCQPFLCSFLIYELSTPFVQFHWMMTRSPKGMWSDKLITINGLFLIVFFFLVRIVWGVYATVYSFILCFKEWNNFPIYLIPTVYILNSGFQFLNFMWFSKMITLAMKSVGGKAQKKDN